MKIPKIAALALLVLSSFAANSVAPSKTELEAMYDKAFKEFDGNNYDAALKDLDAIDARQPDLAESQNLRGVIQMRQKNYANAETALQKALAADPKFWNARFNLAEIPFLQKNWPEARKRFQDLLTGNASELQGEATQLIQYKILITQLMEGKENVVAAAIAKFELAPETPAVHYANAAVALSKKDEKAAKDALTTAEKSFSPQLNKLFAESLYEVGWMEKPAGQTRAALELNSAAEKAAKSKAFAKSKFDEAEQALQQRDLTAARKLVDEADAADPNQASIFNLRGEILLEQKDYDQAENEFKKATKADPKYRDAQYNLAQIPFKKKDYAKARDRFESLFSSTTGADKDRAAQLIKYKIYLTFLLEGKDSRAQKMMEQFQFTGDTPALYYAQAAWEFKHDNAEKANDWVTSARKIYPPALNGVFSDAFFDLGWLQSSAIAAAPATATVAEASAPETAPSIEPTPIPTMTLASEPAKSGEPLTLANTQANPGILGMEATASATAEQSPAASTLLAESSPKVETPVASTASPAAARPVIANASESEAPVATEVVKAAASASPATVLAPAKVREWSEPSLLERLDTRDWLLIAAVLVALLLVAVAVVPSLRRGPAKASAPRTMVPATSPGFNDDEVASEPKGLVSPTRLAGGPPQISLQLRASEPALRRAVMPLSKATRTVANGSGNGHGNGLAVAPVEAYVEPEPLVASPAEFSDAGVGEPVFAARETVEDFASTVSEPSVLESTPAEDFASSEPMLTSEPEPAFEPAFAATSAEAEPIFAPEIAAPIEAAPVEVASIHEEYQETEAPVFAEAVSEFASGSPSALFAEMEPAPAPVSAMPEAPEPIDQGQPIPYLTSAPAVEEPAAEISQPEPAAPRRGLFAAGLAGIGALRHSVSRPSPEPEVVPSEPMAQQSTTPDIMPTPTPIAPAPVIRTGQSTPMSGMTPQTGVAQPAPGGMHTAVHLTFSFEIASLQLTSSFKMGALQLKPTSKIVTMRLAPSQHPQPAMNLQVTFEIATVQLTGNSIGMIRLTPSQQQRPSINSSSSFNIAGLQLVSGAESAPVQITPSQQGQASVHVTGAFQIATVEFSPSFEIASIVLNATSKNVNVQLPGSGPSAVEGAPVFEITNVQLAGNGEIGVMQLNPLGGGAAQQKPA